MSVKGLEEYKIMPNVLTSQARSGLSIMTELQGMFLVAWPSHRTEGVAASLSRSRSLETYFLVYWTQNDRPQQLGVLCSANNSVPSGVAEAYATAEDFRCVKQIPEKFVWVCLQFFP